MKIRDVGAAAWGFRELELEEQLKLCKKLGFYTLELGIANIVGDIPLDAGQNQLERVKELYKLYDMPLLCGATSNDFTSHHAKNISVQVEKVKKVIDICYKLHLPMLRVFAGFMPKEEVVKSIWDRMIKAINECSDYASKCDVTLSIETHGGVEAFGVGVRHVMSVSTNKETLEQMIREMRSDVKFVFDPANLYAVGWETPEDLYHMLKNRIAYIHLKDFVKQEDGSMIPGALGDGELDWKTYMKHCKDFGGIYLIEYELPQDIEHGSRKSLDFVRRL